MSQDDDSELMRQLHKAEEARIKAAKEWQRLDATLFNPEIPQGKKLYLLGHLRTANSETGLMYGSAARLAEAMSAQPQAAERAQRELRKEGVLELIEPGGGRTTNVVKILQPWMDKTEEIYLKRREELRQKIKRLPPPTPALRGGGRQMATTAAQGTPALRGGGRHPRLERQGTPALEGGAPPPWKEADPFRYPAKISSDLDQDLSGPDKEGSATANPSEKYQGHLPSADQKTPSTLERAELHDQATWTGDLPEELSWVELSKLPAHYGKKRGVYFDETLGTLHLVPTEAGRDYLGSLVQAGYGVDTIKLAMDMATSKASTVAARRGGLEGLLRTYCAYALEKQNGRQRSNSAPLARWQQEPYKP